jgi:hypothetical protein
LNSELWWVDKKGVLFSRRMKSAFKGISALKIVERFTCTIRLDNADSSAANQSEEIGT